MPKLSELIRYDPKRGDFMLGSSQAEQNEILATSERTAVDGLLAQLARGSFAQGGDAMRDHRMLAAAMVPPIEQAVPYVRWTTPFFLPQTYGNLEDNALPVEDIVAIAWETHGDAEVLFTRPGILWTRPEFTEWDAGVEAPWKTLRRAGWDVLSRMMRRVTSEIARKVDAAAKTILDTAVESVSQTSTVSGGSLTKASVDAIIKAANAAAFPVTIAAVNSGTATDMNSWTGGVFTYNLPERTADELIQRLTLGTYGQCNFETSPFAPSAYVYFGGPAEETGYEQRRGNAQSNSDVDIVRKVDLHTFTSEEIAWYVGNSYRLRRLQITS